MLLGMAQLRWILLKIEQEQFAKKIREFVTNTRAKNVKMKKEKVSVQNSDNHLFKEEK